MILVLCYYFLHDHDTQAAVLTHRKDFWIFVFCIILSWFGAHDDDDHKQHAAWRMEEVAELTTESEARCAQLGFRNVMVSA